VGAQPAILYDDDCGFCKWALDKILAWDRGRMLRPVAIQSEKGATLLASVPESERLESWHLVQPSGEVISAGAGAPALAELLPGGRPLAALFRRFPKSTDRAYRFVAEHRAGFAKLVRADASCQLRR
jgi:predicted DCC family thiol-disulfide oxidoreductase YuxK